jgi:GT2 family glycosyltransferase
MAVRRSALQEVGGFDEYLGAGTPFPSEDVEILARLSARGHGGCYDPDPVVLHHHGRKAGDDIRRLSTAYDRGRGAYYLKCLFIPAFRVTACRELYQSFRDDLHRLRRDRRLQWQFVNEIRGAVGYAGARIAGRVRGALSPR